MAGKKRSGLANDKRAYGCGRYCGYTQSTNGNPSPIPTPTPTPPTTTYTVTYNGNDFTGGSVPTDGSSPYTAGTPVIVLGNTGSLVKIGNTFTGWNTAADGSGISYSPGATFSMPSSNVILYAQWTPVVPLTYTVTYLGNGNNSGTFPPTDLSSPYISGSTVTVLGNSGSPILAKTSNQFAGWNTAADGSGTNYVGGDIFTINADTILYANWIIGGFRITYNGNGFTEGTVPSSSGTFYPAYSTENIVGNTGSLANTISPVFAGWNTSATGTGTSYPVGSTITMSQNYTLYAQWIPAGGPYTLIYDPNGGSGTAPASPTSYSAGSPANILGNTGYTNGSLIFNGWNTATDGSGTSYPAGSKITMTSNTTLYAQWGSSPAVTVTYDANNATGGSVPAAPTNYPTGVQVPILGQGSLTRPGYTFLGWNSSSTGVGSLYAPGYTFTSKTVTLFAQWAPGSPVKNCGGGTIGATYIGYTFPYAMVIQSSDTVTIYTTALASQIPASTSPNTYGSGTAPEGLISISSKVVITSSTIQINTNTTYAVTSENNYSQTINNNGSGFIYWPSGQTLLPITLPTIQPRISNPPTYYGSTRNVSNGCGLIASENSSSGNVCAFGFFIQGVTLNYSAGSSTQIISCPTNAVYRNSGGSFVTAPNSLYPYSLITPRSSAALTAITIIPSGCSAYVSPDMPDYTVQYDGNGNTSGTLPDPQYMSPYVSGTTSITLRTNSGVLAKTGFTFSGWNTAANGTGTSYAVSATYNGTASLILYAKWV
jgi:uncharacterized repeat protein (TIGR02543 family)